MAGAEDCDRAIDADATVNCGNSAQSATSTNDSPAASVSNGTLAPIDGLSPTVQPFFYTLREQQAVKAIMEVIKNEYEVLPRSADLCAGDVQQAITEKVYEALTPAQLELEDVNDDRLDRAALAAIVAQTTQTVAQMTIDIPRITVVPTGAVSGVFRSFTLDLQGVHYQPVEQNILIQHLQSHAQYRLHNATGVATEAAPADYLVRSLIDYNDINYDAHADLLYDLANQMVAHLRNYLLGEADLLNVLQYHETKLAALIHTQMQAHYEEYATGYEAHVSHGFTVLDGATYPIPPDQELRNFRQPLDSRREIRSMIFGGFQRCLLAAQKFDSDAERRFAVVLENEPDETLKWLKPPRGTFRIYYQGDRRYEPDYVVESATTKYICEPKRADELEDRDVQAKARAAVTWCQHASEHAVRHGGKPWRYLLIPHDAIAENMTLAGLAGLYVREYEELTKLTPRWQEREILMVCALRFDGYRYQEESDFDYQVGLDRYMATGSWSHLSELEQLTVFFMFQRYLYKWGGEYLANYSPEWRGFRELFFLNCRREIPPAYQMADYIQRWEQEFRPHIEECITRVRHVHMTTQYATETTLDPGYTKATCRT
ncbi:MAG: hypothetical protein R2867_07675 [Caldilineaceae bacterium]